jgi:hypothetical protein
MVTEETVTNRDGDEWLVKQRESACLTDIGGFLMTYQDVSRIVISAHLTETNKARGRDVLRSHLTQIAVGTSGTILWHPDDNPL